MERNGMGILGIIFSEMDSKGVWNGATRRNGTEWYVVSNLKWNGIVWNGIL